MYDFTVVDHLKDFFLGSQPCQSDRSLVFWCNLKKTIEKIVSCYNSFGTFWNRTCDWQIQSFYHWTLMCLYHLYVCMDDEHIVYTDAYPH